MRKVSPKNFNNNTQRFVLRPAPPKISADNDIIRLRQFHHFIPVSVSQKHPTDTVLYTPKRPCLSHYKTP